MDARRFLRAATSSVGVAAIVALSATPALADGGLSGQTCCDPGGAKVTAYADFTSRYGVTVKDIRLKDLCPGDGHSVYVEFQYKQSARGDWVTRGDKREHHGGCGTTQDEADYRFVATSGRIAAVRLRVCVDESFPNPDDCQSTNYRNNQYP